MKTKKAALLRYWKDHHIITDEHVLDAFQKVRRELFVLPEHKDRSYEDYPLPIGQDQTISQPTTVMMMTQALEVKKGQKILEIGAGSGYQAALLSALVGNAGMIYTIERIPYLVSFAKANLEKAGIKNVKVIEGDGTLGYRQEQPYDRVMVTAAAPHVPQPLTEQLAQKGILLIPVGGLFHQVLLKITKQKNRYHEKTLGDFSFVPLKGAYGY
ncbi:protein-L-isoaspartate(D-aspartate) O-methyltransferase [Candidatus Woesearchaeota archaeon]|nr:protein-L-isoaspartate(D-aspartate) O-methyltransferase [Candidatus Woesearchaeota archaeon]